MSSYTVGTFVDYYDESAITPISIASVQDQPTFMCTFTSDKGREDWGVYSGANFFKMFGDRISFAKHGQPLLNAATAINAGAKLFCKRVVANDASLANLAIVAEVTTVQVQKTDADGNKIYLDEEGVETIEVTASPVMQSVASVKYSAKSAVGTKDHASAMAAVRAEIGSTAGTYLLYMFTDIGRGISDKRIRIQPNYMLSKNTDYMMYNFGVLENGTTSESMDFVLDPNKIVNDANVSLGNVVRTNSLQVSCYQEEEDINAFTTKIIEITGMTAEEAAGADILFGTTKKGAPLKSVTVDATGLNLQHPYGQVLANGDNGAFANAPINAATYASEVVKAWDGSFSNDIYNVDKYKVDVIIDANYPATVKRAIENLADFREDAFYFRDLGLGLNTLDLIVNANKTSSRSIFCASYHNSYDIIDPYSKKQVSVTVGYSLSKLLVGHIVNGRSRPLAGLKFSMILADAIDGTLNFVPTVCPGVNQRETLEDERINYASYINNDLVLETLYTSQEKLSGFSYINNILAIQEVIKVIRTRAPVIRYSFIDGADLETYKKDVESFIDPYRGNFASINMKYMGDANYVAQKIYYAMIEVSFRDFAQTEYFKVVAIANTGAAT